MVKSSPIERSFDGNSLACESLAATRMEEHDTGLSSYQVFMSFVRHKGGNQVEVGDIFSERCFRLWLDTRGREIKFPQQSFQRVLYAHIRAADHRKPFPPQVEAALLRTLRAHKESNPWAELFRDHCQKLGKRGFKRKGYHELASQKQTGNDISLLPTVPESKPSAKRSNKTKAMDAVTRSESGGLGPVTEVEIRGKRPKLEQLEPEHEREGGRHACPVSHLRSPINSFADLNVGSRHNLLASISSINDMGRTSRAIGAEFYLPSPQQAAFEMDSKAIGKIVFNQFDWKIVAEDEAAQVMFNGPLVDGYLSSMVFNWPQNQILYSNINTVSSLYGPLWRRDVLRKRNGIFAVFLLRIVALGPLCIMQLQEQHEWAFSIPSLLGLNSDPLPFENKSGNPSRTYSTACTGNILA